MLPRAWISSCLLGEGFKFRVCSLWDVFELILCVPMNVCSSRRLGYGYSHRETYLSFCQMMFIGNLSNFSRHETTSGVTYEFSNFSDQKCFYAKSPEKPSSLWEKYPEPSGGPYRPGRAPWQKFIQSMFGFCTVLWSERDANSQT